MAGLRAQTLPLENWELMIFDNCSDPPVDESWRPTWHPRFSWEYVSISGKANAINRGIEKASGDLICVVDDDNVLDTTVRLKIGQSP